MHLSIKLIKIDALLAMRDIFITCLANKPENMPGGLGLRLAQVLKKAWSETQVKTENSNHKVLNIKDMRMAAGLHKMMSQLVLAPLKLTPRPIPFFRDTNFIAEFADPYVQNSVQLIYLKYSLIYRYILV